MKDEQMESAQEVRRKQLPIDSLRAIPVDVPENLKNIHIILVEPTEPGNIGSTARAMKGMGLTQLVLVNPAPWRESEDAWRLARVSEDVLENSRVVETIEEAIEGVHYLVATTHRRRLAKLPPPVIAREAAQNIASISQDKTVGLLFGRESSGLTSEELSLCQLVASVPMALRNPPLNLSHAVLVFAYEIFMASLGEIPNQPLDLVEVAELERFYQKIIDILTKVEFVPYNNDWKTMLFAIRRAFGRMNLEKRDLEVLYQIFSEIDKHVIRISEKS